MASLEDEEEDGGRQEKQRREKKDSGRFVIGNVQYIAELLQKDCKIVLLQGSFVVPMQFLK